MDECKIPLCKNHIGENGQICSSCMINSVRRYMQAEGSWTVSGKPTNYQISRAKYWYDFLVINIESIVKKEEQSILMYGRDYDRDDEDPIIKVEYE